MLSINNKGECKVILHIKVCLQVLGSWGGLLHMCEQSYIKTHGSKGSCTKSYKSTRLIVVIT